MIEWIQTKKNGVNSRGYYLTIAVSKSGRNSSGNENPHALCIRFSEEAAKDFRLIAGDRLQIGFDKQTKQVCFKRTLTQTPNSFKVSENKSSSKRILTVQVQTELPWHQAISISKKEVREESGHIAIDCPTIFKVAA